jgi:hypothetical protein
MLYYDEFLPLRPKWGTGDYKTRSIQRLSATSSNKNIVIWPNTGQNIWPIFVRPKIDHIVNWLHIQTFVQKRHDISLNCSEQVKMMLKGN